MNLKYPLTYHRNSLKEYRQQDRYINNENNACNASEYILHFLYRPYPLSTLDIIIIFQIFIIYFILYLSLNIMVVALEKGK